MRTIRAIIACYWAKFVPFEIRLVESQLERQDAETTACTTEASRIEAHADTLARSIAQAMSPASPGGTTITPDEARPICRATLDLRRFTTPHTQHLRTLL